MGEARMDGSTAVIGTAKAGSHRARPIAAAGACSDAIFRAPGLERLQGVECGAQPLVTQGGQRVQAGPQQFALLGGPLKPQRTLLEGCDQVEIVLRHGKTVAYQLELDGLAGDLGSGKTTFTKYLAEAMWIKDVVNSPTFTILKIYQGTIPL